MNIATNNTTGAVIQNATSAPSADWTLQTNVTLPAKPAGPGKYRLAWQNNALAWVAPAVTLATLAAALNASLTALFETAPIQAQVVFSNITTPIAALITAGQLAQAAVALQGMLNDQLVPPGYSAFIDPAVALITAQEAAFAAVMPAPAAPAPAAAPAS